MVVSATMKQRSKGGRGYAEELRNEALVILRKQDEKKFSFSVIGELLNIRKQTAQSIYERDKDKYFVRTYAQG